MLSDWYIGYMGCQNSGLVKIGGPVVEIMVDHVGVGHFPF
jgi:hypothetical protein